MATALRVCRIRPHNLEVELQGLETMRADQACLHSTTISILCDHTLAVLLSVFLIQAQSSGILNGLEIMSSIPACKAISTCSDLAFAVTAMTGM